MKNKAVCAACGNPEACWRADVAEFGCDECRIHAAAAVWRRALRKLLRQD